MYKVLLMHPDYNKAVQKCSIKFKFWRWRYKIQIFDLILGELVKGR